MRLFALFFILITLIILPSLLYLNFTVIHTHEELLQSVSEKTGSKIVMGPVVMPRLGNSTVKAELGRSSWKLLHTMMSRFPENPTPDEKYALRSFIYLFSRLYPCGECAIEFQKILEMYPPQVSSGEAASQWACSVHNIVNKRLEKEMFDCGKIAEKYKCGCEDDDKVVSEPIGKTISTTNI